MSVCVFVHICIHRPFYVHVLMHVRICKHIYIYLYIHIHIHLYNYIYTYIYIYMYTKKYICTYRCTCTYTYTHVHVHIDVYTHIDVYICTYTCSCLHLHIHMHIHIPIHIHLLIDVHIDTEVFCLNTRRLVTLIPEKKWATHRFICRCLDVNARAVLGYTNSGCSCMLHTCTNGNLRLHTP